MTVKIWNLTPNHQNWQARQKVGKNLSEWQAADVPAGTGELLAIYVKRSHYPWE